MRVVCRNGERGGVYLLPWSFCRDCTETSLMMKVAWPRTERFRLFAQGFFWSGCSCCEWCQDSWTSGKKKTPYWTDESNVCPLNILEDLTRIKIDTGLFASRFPWCTVFMHTVSDLQIFFPPSTPSKYINNPIFVPTESNGCYRIVDTSRVPDLWVILFQACKMFFWCIPLFGWWKGNWQLCVSKKQTNKKPMKLRAWIKNIPTAYHSRHLTALENGTGILYCKW